MCSVRRQLFYSVQCAEAAGLQFTVCGGNWFTVYSVHGATGLIFCARNVPSFDQKLIRGGEGSGRGDGGASSFIMHTFCTGLIKKWRTCYTVLAVDAWDHCKKNKFAY